jgi:Protein of unknown function (DUF1573)
MSIVTLTEGIAKSMMLTKSTTVTAVLLVLGTVAFGAGPPVRQDDKMFPDGRTYDFGKVKRGTPVKFTLRFVNTSDVTLEVSSVKVHMGPMNARMAKWILQPQEVGTVEVTVDTTRFVGRKTMLLWLETKHGEVSQTFDFRITGIAEHQP